MSRGETVGIMRVIESFFRRQDRNIYHSIKLISVKRNENSVALNIQGTTIFILQYRWVFITGMFRQVLAQMEKKVRVSESVDSGNFLIFCLLCGLRLYQKVSCFNRVFITLFFFWIRSRKTSRWKILTWYRFVMSDLLILQGPPQFRRIT